MTRRKHEHERKIPTAARIAEIRGLMVTNSYTSEVRLELARRWGVGTKRVEKLATEASRQLRVPPEQLDELRAQHAAVLDEIVRIAMTERSETTGLRDLRSAIEAVLLSAKFRGVAPPEAPLVNVGVAAAPITISPEVAKAFDDPDTWCPACNGTGRTGPTNGAPRLGPAILMSPQ